jgi:MFS family permease
MLLDRTPKKTIGVNLLVLAVLGFATVQMVQFCYSLVEPASITTIFHLAGIPVTSHTVQWSIVALGLYCVFTWSQTFKLRDPASHTLICRTPSSVLVIVAGSAAMTISYGVMGWAPHFAVITYEQSLASIGMKFGITATIVGIGGTLLGGYLGDRLNRTNPCGRLYVTLGAIVLMVPAALFTFTRPTLGSFLTGFAILSLASTAWLPGVLSTLQELVLPRMRGLIYATYYLVVTIIGLGTGPYVAGLVSDITGDLRTGILSLYFAAPVVWLCLGVAIYRLQKDIDSRFARARDAGEVTAAEPEVSIA